MTYLIRQAEFRRCLQMLEKGFVLEKKTGIILYVESIAA